MHQQGGIGRCEIQAADQLGHAPQPLEVPGAGTAAARELAELVVAELLQRSPGVDSCGHQFPLLITEALG